MNEEVKERVVNPWLVATPTLIIFNFMATRNHLVADYLIWHRTFLTLYYAYINLSVSQAQNQTTSLTTPWF